MSAPDPERQAARVAELLSRPGAWVRAEGGGYAVRSGEDRRRRAAATFGESVFRRLAREPGLKLRPAGGWSLARTATVRDSPPPPGRPGVIEGEREVTEPDGRLVRRRANLGESPIAWLARRKGPDGAPWLTAAEAAAGERLREDFERARIVGRITMCWDASPRAAGGRGPGLDPAETRVAAKARGRAALDAVGPGLRDILERVCLTGSALEAAERGLNLPRRSGKTLLKLGLQRLAAHYGIG
ncbi:MAG TPA: DUF6456 domain-containing protein [Caulobacteraceae bacterium]|nr:DUF6456 domain-containing protein [Caulobacteraceae bacterium]